MHSRLPNSVEHSHGRRSSNAGLTQVQQHQWSRRAACCADTGPTCAHNGDPLTPLLEYCPPPSTPLLLYPANATHALNEVLVQGQGLLLVGPVALGLSQDVQVEAQGADLATQLLAGLGPGVKCRRQQQCRRSRTHRNMASMKITVLTRYRRRGEQADAGNKQHR